MGRYKGKRGGLQALALVGGPRQQSPKYSPFGKQFEAIPSAENPANMALSSVMHVDAFAPVAA
jgi:hypothetical protein